MCADHLPLAPPISVCLTPTIVQLARSFAALRRALKPAVASLLAVLLVWLVTFAPTSFFHSSLHDDTHDHAAPCVICLFAHSQVDTIGLGAVCVLFLAVCVGLAPLARQLVLASLDLRLAPSRAPPRFSGSSLR